jgi:hypothetical protein
MTAGGVISLANAERLHLFRENQKICGFLNPIRASISIHRTTQ